MLACTDTSRAETGSSAISTFGSRASARAMPIRCRCPPENCLRAAGRAPARGRPTSSISSRLRSSTLPAGRACGSAAARRASADGHPRVQRAVRVLEDHLDQRAAASVSGAPCKRRRRRSGSSPAVGRYRPTTQRAERRLAAARLPDQPERLPAVQRRGRRRRRRGRPAARADQPVGRSTTRRREVLDQALDRSRILAPGRCGPRSLGGHARSFLPRRSASWPASSAVRERASRRWPAGQTGSSGGSSRVHALDRRPGSAVRTSTRRSMSCARSGGWPGMVSSRATGRPGRAPSAAARRVRVPRRVQQLGGRPVLDDRPPYMTLSRAQVWLTTARSWLTSSSPDALLRRRPASTPRTWAWIVTSSAVVGSSARISRGSVDSAIAMQIRCRMPPDSSCG